MNISNFKNKKLCAIKCALIVIVLIFLLFISGYFTLRKVIYPLKYIDIITKEASKNNIDPYLLLSVVKIESNFNPNATSNKGAKGLMQMIYSTALEVNQKLKIYDTISEDELYDVDFNLTIGADYLGMLIKRYNGNYYLAICAYNAGLGNVDKWIENGIVSENLDDYNENDIPFNETKRYLKNIIKTYKMYKVLY